jgi:OmpA family
MKAAALSCIVAIGVTAAAAPAGARPVVVGGWVGPRFFSDNSRLGMRDVVAPAALTSSLAVGARIGWPLLAGRLIPEIELTLTSTNTEPFDVGVVWIEPRLALRYEWPVGSRLRPFALIGGGSPISVSGNRDVFATQIIGEGFLGGGASLWTGKGFALRFDARLMLGPGEDPRVAMEGELGVGVSIPLGAGARVRELAPPPPPPPDRDHDRIADSADACPDRAEDLDGFQDLDGCPDIDNDVDTVLDIADACPLEPETYNGITDDDGCPDALPAELAAIVGPVRSASYQPGVGTPQRSAALTVAFDRMAAVLRAYPAVRVRVVGHTDDQEAAPRAPGPEGELPDAAALALALGQTRALMARELLVTRGLTEERVLVDSRGAEEPVGDNQTAAGRQANRRIELLLVVPER